jgi:hypothetical protein
MIIEWCVVKIVVVVCSFGEAVKKTFVAFARL